jgi:hypothetical protein
LSAIGAPTALAGDDSDVAGMAVDTPAAPPTALAPATQAPEQADPVSPEPAPVAPAPADPAPVQPTPAPSNPAPANPAPSHTAPANPAPVDATPAPSGHPALESRPAPTPTSVGPEPAGAGSSTDMSRAGTEAITPDSEDEADESSPSEPASDDGPRAVIAVSHNRSMVFQVVWQVQQGCRIYCHGTSQSQSMTQWSSTAQTASATAEGRRSADPASTSSAALARNESITIQFAWQMQIGCVAFCYETSQTQVASQWAQTTQTAAAVGDVEAWAENLSETLQFLWQIQRGCEQECHGVQQSQTASQGTSTIQSATGTAASEDASVLIMGPDGVVGVPGWVVALATNVGATIETVYQYQEAACLEHCDGGAQTQVAVQKASTDQEATALASVAPPAERPLAEQAPVEEPPATKPSAGPTKPGAPNPAAVVTAGTAAPAPINGGPLTPGKIRVLLRRATLIQVVRDEDDRSAGDAVPRTSGGAPLSPSGASFASFSSPALPVPLPTSTSHTDASPRTGVRTIATGSAHRLPSFSLGSRLDVADAHRGFRWLAILVAAAALGLLLALGSAARRAPLTRPAP